MSKRADFISALSFYAIIVIEVKDDKSFTTRNKQSKGRYSGYI